MSKVFTLLLLAPSLALASGGMATRAASEDMQLAASSVGAGQRDREQSVSPDEETALAEESTLAVDPDNDVSGTGRGIRTAVLYRLDPRYMQDSHNGSRLELMSAEAEVNASIGDSLDAAIQVPLASAMTGRGRGMHFGNAYVVVRRNIGDPTVKMGQFVVPFGNLVDYETHTRILQTLYPYSLGVRIDPGIEIEGFLGGQTEFQLAVTQGNGPFRGDADSNEAVWARFSRRLEIGEDDLRIGASAMSGRLPVFSLMADPLMDGKRAKLLHTESGMQVDQSDPHGFAHKKRYALDLEWYRGIDLIRAELVIGSDNGRDANGQWLQIEHPLSYSTSIVGQVSRWKQFSGDLQSWAVGAEHKLTDNRILRAAFEQRRVDEMGMTMTMNMFTTQYLLEF